MYGSPSASPLPVHSPSVSFKGKGRAVDTNIDDINEPRAYSISISHRSISITLKPLSDAVDLEEHSPLLEHQDESRESYSGDENYD